MLVDNLKLLLKLKSTSLYEEVSQTYMYAYGADTVVRVLSDGGYVMQNDQYLLGEGVPSSGYALLISDAFTLGFWLYPVNPGLAIDPVTDNAVSITMPVLDFNEIGSTNDSIIRITENTTPDETNYLTVSFNEDTYYASSENYSPSIWHYFWIVYDGSNLVVYIDGNQQTLQNENGSLPATLNGSYLDLYINHNLAGYAYNIAKNYGYISDLFMFNVANTTQGDIQRVVNDGIEYLTDTLYTDTYIEKYSIYFDDPHTITITSSIDDMTYVYLGRNDGKILRGSPLLWEARKIYSNSDEATLLGLSNNSADDDNISGGFLKLKSKSIRL